MGDDFSASGSGIQQHNPLLKAFSANIDLPKAWEYPKHQGHHTDRFQYSTSCYKF